MPGTPSMIEDDTLQHDWTTTIDAKGIADWINEQHSLLLLTHAKPDGDALGSTVALARAINITRNSSGAASLAECWYAAPMPSGPRPSATPAAHRRDNQPVPGAFYLRGHPHHRHRLVVPAAPSPRSSSSPPRLTTIVDYHSLQDGEIASRRLILKRPRSFSPPPRSAATCPVSIARAKLPVDVATPLYVGKLGDGHRGSSTNADGRVMRIGWAAARRGREPYLPVAMLYQHMTGRRDSSLRAALESMQPLSDSTPRSCASCFRLAETAARRDRRVDIPQSVASIRVVAILTEQKDSDTFSTKVSCSKPDEWDGKPPTLMSIRPATPRRRRPRSGGGMQDPSSA
ncbi:MAG: hypothetical protein R3B67_02260 [Phycisphaerales bacterium]